jgi:hypothetical protein
LQRNWNGTASLKALTFNIDFCFWSGSKPLPTAFDTSKEIIGAAAKRALVANFLSIPFPAAAA